MPSVWDLDYDPANIYLFIVKIETVEKGLQYVQRKQQKHQSDINNGVLLFCCLLWTYFTPFSTVLIVDFERVNVSWGGG